MREVGVSGQRLLDVVVAEYEASCAGQLDLRYHHVPVPGGIVEFCGTEADPNCWNAAYVTNDTRAVLPLVSGHHDRVVREYERLDVDETPFWDAARYPPPIVRVGGQLFYFAPARGRLLLGQVRLDDRAVLLAATGDEHIAVIHVKGRVRSVLHVGPPHSIRELDVDRLLRLQRRAGGGPVRPDPLDPVRPTAAILAHHRRIVLGITVDVGPGPTLAEVLTASFEDLADRARALRPSNGKPLRGKRWIRHVIRFFCKLAIRDVGDLVGRIGEIIAAIQEHFPAFKITHEAMSDVLGRLHALGTCIVSRRQPSSRSSSPAPASRIWQINLAGLLDPRSAIHRRLCRETRARRVGAVPIGVICEAEQTTARGADDDAVPHDQTPGEAPRPFDPATDTVVAPSPADAASPDPPITPDAPADDPTVAAPAPADTASPDPPITPDAPADHPSKGDDADDLAAALRELLTLPPAAGRTLLLGGRVHREARITARRAGNPIVSDDPSPPPQAELGRPLPSSRRRLHLSSDHTFGLPRLAVVAHAAASAPRDSQPHPENSAGRPRPAGRRHRRARGPPDNPPS